MNKSDKQTQETLKNLEIALEEAKDLPINTSDARSDEAEVATKLLSAVFNEKSLLSAKNFKKLQKASHMVVAFQKASKQKVSKKLKSLVRDIDTSVKNNKEARQDKSIVEIPKLIDGNGFVATITCLDLRIAATTMVSASDRYKHASAAFRNYNARHPGVYGSEASSESMAASASIYGQITNGIDMTLARFDYLSKAKKPKLGQ